MADPDVMQQYVDYVILDPSQSSVRMQAPLLDPYTYRQVGGDPFKTHKSLSCFFLLFYPIKNLKRHDSRKAACAEIRNLRKTENLTILPSPVEHV